MKLTSNNKTANIETAKCILTDLGLKDFDFSAYSDTNGVSVYFLYNGKKIRVSDHSVTNISRIENEFHFSFDRRRLGIGGKITLEDSQKRNKLFATNIYNLI